MRPTLYKIKQFIPSVQPQVCSLQGMRRFGTHGLLVRLPAYLASMCGTTACVSRRARRLEF